MSKNAQENMKKCKKKKKNDYDMPQYASEHLVKISQNSTQNNLDLLILKKNELKD